MTKPEVLIVEDDSTVATLLQIVLTRRCPYNITTATDGAEAIAAIEKKRFDLVKSDYDLPRYNGLQVYKRLRELYPDVPFILCTSKDLLDLSPIPEDIRFIQKPFTPDQVCNAIDEMLGH